MNWEAFFAIGIFTIILGVVLYIPGRLWAKRKLKEHPNTQASLKVTKFGYILTSSMLLVLFGGLSFQYFSPNSFFGEYMKTKTGRLTFTALVIIIFVLVERIFKTKGYTMLVDKKYGNV